MIKISALNRESDEETGCEDEVTKEALEQIAIQQYSKALELQRKDNITDAMQLLKDLLETELLDDVKKPTPGETGGEPLYNLKYLCHKNVAAMQASSGDLEGAIDSYCAAAELDDTDVTLWHRLGQLCINAKRYEMALYAFQKGVTCNPRHWPCLDKVVTLHLGLGNYEDCISVIHDTLQLDPGYLRGLAYQKHIYTIYPYVRDYMEYVDKKYKWVETEDEIDELKSALLVKEAEAINSSYMEILKAEEISYVIPVLKLKNPIHTFSWLSVGKSLVSMHNFMTENCYSHVCPIELVFEKEIEVEKMETDEEIKKPESAESKSDGKSDDNNTDTEKNTENGSDENNDLSDKDKVTDSDKMESDVEMVAPETIESASAQTTAESKEQRKQPVRRRGSDLSFLQQWEWCNKRRSGRKKPVVKDTASDNIYDVLRKMIPISLVPGIVAKKEHQKREGSPDITDLDKLFDDKVEDKEMTDITETATMEEGKPFESLNEVYFGSETEQRDVERFINKYTENKSDIIIMMNEFVTTLSEKWRESWPDELHRTFVDLNNCYKTHNEVPNTYDDGEYIMEYVVANLLCEEFVVNDKLNDETDDKVSHDLTVIECIGQLLTEKPDAFTSDCLELTLRYHWVKLHIHLVNKNDEFALDCLYHLLYEFEGMGEHKSEYSISVPNFTFKPTINDNEIAAYIKFLERNKQLSTVSELYDGGHYKEALSILIDSFEHCKNISKKQEDEMSLHFAVQLSFILDGFWALDQTEDCLKWSFDCLHEALKHFFHYTSGCQDHEKWSLAVVKILCCMEHILATEGLCYLESIPSTVLSQGLEDIIRVIGHQVETNATEMPLDTVVPWILLHYILQREEDQGRSRTLVDKELCVSDEVPNPLMVLFIGHEQLGGHGWCGKSEGKLLHFILDTVVPRLRSPAMQRCIEHVLQYMEQCVFCLFGHPAKKNKVKYLEEHSVTAVTLDWPRAQQVYEIFRPLTLPELQGKVTALTAETEQLFLRILALMPQDYEFQKYIPEIERFMNGKETKLPTIPIVFPFKMRDIYFLLGDYYFKKEEARMSIKYNMFDVLINNNRFESWAQITLAKAVNLERILNSCNNINNEKDFMKPARTIIRCFKRSLELESNCDIWIEYGVFSYAVHSFCSRLLKQASESLSMDDFDALEKQKDDMLATTEKCFTSVVEELTHHPDLDKVHEGTWLAYYMLGKVAEKRNKPPSVFTDFYLKSMHSLSKADAVYPSKINYNSPQNFSIEVLEVHYRIHASILKYMEQHENKPMPTALGKTFQNTIDEWKNGPFCKKPKKNGTAETENIETKSSDTVPHAANILKRSISDAGEEDNSEAKRLKLESAAAKVRRSASYDTERVVTNDKNPTPTLQVNGNKTADTELSTVPEAVATDTLKTDEAPKENGESTSNVVKEPESKPKEVINGTEAKPGDKKVETSSSASTSSSSDSSSSSTSSESSSDSSRDSETSAKLNEVKNLSDEDVMSLIKACLNALEDCVSKFPLHYKALYRIAHYHFYYKKGKDVEKCRDVMFTNFTSHLGAKTSGLFGERKNTNFFNNIWRIPLSEIDRPGGFANHMNRCVLLTMEILKEIDDHKSLLDMSMQLQRIPEPDKKYLRDSDREELAQQAFLLCVQSLKGQLQKFSQQPDLKSNEVEKKAFNSLMLDIYRAYQRAQKQPGSKQFTNLLVEGFKLVTTITITETTNLVDLSMKYCQSLVQTLKQQATQASIDKSQNAQKKVKTVEAPKPTASTATVTSQPKTDKPLPTPAPPPAPTLPKMSPQDMASAFKNYAPMLSDPMMSQQTAAALSLSYLSNLSALAGYTALQNSLQSSLQSSLQNSFQAEFYRQFIGQSMAPFTLPPPQKKQKRPAKPAKPIANVSGLMKAKSFSGVGQSLMAKLPPSTSVLKPTAGLHKSSSASLAPSMGTVLSSLPASMSSILTSSYQQSLMHSAHAKPHGSGAKQQQVSPSKTLQEKLAEKQKSMPASKQLDLGVNPLARLPSSLTITKASASKPTASVKKQEVKKPHSFKPVEKPRPISSDEVIVLDDD